MERNEKATCGHGCPYYDYKRSICKAMPKVRPKKSFNWCGQHPDFDRDQQKEPLTYISLALDAIAKNLQQINQNTP